MPVLADGTAKRRTINAPLLANIVLQHGPVAHAYIEYVGARPGDGAVGAFAFGRCRGIIEGVLRALLS
jgi:crossover junction endodeoxyribonuclease RuvC